MQQWSCLCTVLENAGAQWEKAAELFEQMQAKGCKPDSVTYGGLILAYEKGDQWRRALAAFEQMKNNNCRPDSVVYNTVVGVLWNTGVVWAQAKAVQVGCFTDVIICIIIYLLIDAVLWACLQRLKLPPNNPDNNVLKASPDSSDNQPPRRAVECMAQGLFKPSWHHSPSVPSLFPVKHQSGMGSS